MMGMMVAVVIPAASLLGSTVSDRVVGRNVIEPPVDAHQYPSPLFSYRHYSKDLEGESLIRVSNLSKEVHVRLDAMNVYDGTTSGMGTSNTTDDATGYRRVGSTVPGCNADTADVQIPVSVS